MIVAVIQARVGSTRLPGKVMKELCGHPMLWHQIQRVKRAKRVDKVIVATTNRPEDIPILDLAREAGVQGLSGSTEDVLDRIYQVTKGTGATAIIRLTGDCPLLDPEVVDQLVDYYSSHQHEVDYVTLSPEWPVGFDAEILSADALAKAWKEAKKPYEREHVTPYVAIGGKFRIHRLASPQNLSNLRLTVDEAKDFETVEKIYHELYPKHGHDFGLTEILDLAERRPEVFKHNDGIQHNQRFIQALIEDRQVLRYTPHPTLTKSNEVWEKAEPLIPSGTQTLSKGPSDFVQGVSPIYLARGKGSHVWDVDGNEYIDYPMGLGAVILGHSYPRVNEAIRDQLERGISFSLMNPLEVELAELLKSVIPWAEMVRYGKNGSDVTTGAIRAVRAYTGREKILHCGYHGWHDWYISSTTRDKGIPKSTGELQFDFPYNDLPAVERLFQQHHGEIAGVIMEPYRTTPAEPGFMEGVRDLAHDNGALLIYDEVASGFRFRMGGVQELYGVVPDLGCFGKGMGNGMPISAIVGKTEYMKIFDEIFFSFTFGGECLSLAASIATIQEMQVTDAHTHIWEVGSRLQEGYNRMASDMNLEKNTNVVGLPPLTVPLFRDNNGNDSLLLKSLFQQEVMKRGILFGAAHDVSYSHSIEDIDMTLAAYYEALQVIKKALDDEDIESFLAGTPVMPVFRPQI